MPPDPGGDVVGGRSSHPDLRTGTPAWAGGSALGGKSRTFAQILEDEKRNRNILEINISKITGL